MKFHARSYHLLVAAVTIGVAAAALATTLALAQDTGPVKNTPHDPMAGLSPAQREAIVASAHARNDEFLRNFVAQHRDPRSLPVGWLDSYAAPPASLTAATADADLIVHGRVQNVTFERNPSGGMPISTAQVQVLDTVKGHAAQRISVGQLGGPVAKGDGGALVQFRGSELILPGDEVVLLLKQVGAGEPFRTVFGAGTYLVRNGVIAGENAEHYGVSGQPLQWFVNKLSAGG
jgi:hypothetical protein